MNRLFLFFSIILLLTSGFSYSQQGFLFVKKGFKKKRTYTEGDAIKLKTKDGSYYNGTITLLRNDTIFINGKPVNCHTVSDIILKELPPVPFPDIKTLLLIGGGAALTTAGLTLSHQASFAEALTAGLVIGYGPLIVKYLGVKFIRMLKRKKFRTGRKFYLQVLDFHIPGNKLRSF